MRHNVVCSYLPLQQRQLNASKGSTKKPNLHSMPPRTLTNVPSLVRRPFVALSDYNPFTSSTSTRPDLELPLNAGEMVTVIGDVDANGYYTVEKGGISLYKLQLL
jgi:hypothetical protein